MKSIKRVAALVMALLFVGVGVLSNVGTISQVDAAAKISVKKKTLNQGQKVTLKVTGAKGTIKWSVNNDNVKLNKTTGKKIKVTAVKAGTSKVTAVAGGKKLVSTIKVNGLNIVNKALNVGQKFTIQLKGLGKKVKWSATGSAVTVKGKKAKATVTAKKAGKATVIAKVGKKNYKCTVVVSSPKVSGAKKVSVESGASTKLALSGIQSGTTVTWKSSNSSLVKVTGTGANATVTVIGSADVATDVTVSAVVNGVTYTWTVTVPAKVVEPVLPVEGSQDNPIVLIGTEESVTIPAGETVWYQGKYVGMNLSATGSGMFSVTHNGETTETTSYWPGVEVGPLVGMSTTSFAITNNADAEQTITLNFSYPYGSSMNPAELYALTSVYTSLPAAGMMDSYEGYFYTYTPEVDETVELLVQEITSDSDAEVEIIVSMTTEEGGSVVKTLLEDGVDGVLTIEFKAGVTATINVAVMPDRLWNRPAAVVMWGMPFGTEVNPLNVNDITTEVPVEAGASYYTQSTYYPGNTVEITGGDCVAIIDGVEYPSVDGIVSVDIPASTGYWVQPVSIVIQNTGDVAVVYKINVLIPEGTWDNPKVITDLSSITAELSAAGMMDNYSGYFFKYVAVEDGTVSLEIKDIVSDVADATADITLSCGLVTNTLIYDGVDGVVSIDVVAGDEVIINISMLPGIDWSKPAATVTVGTPSASPDTGLDTDADKDGGYGQIF